MAGPLWGGGGKGPDIKEKITVFGTFKKILLQFINKNNFSLDNLSKYRHFTLKFVVRYFIYIVKIFSKYRAILVQKFRQKKIVKIRFWLFYDKKRFYGH